MSSNAFGNVTEKVGKKGQASPVKIPHAEDQPCPKAPKQGAFVNHRLYNLVSGKTICQYCRVDWATLDARIRKTAGWKADQ